MINIDGKFMVYPNRNYKASRSTDMQRWMTHLQLSSEEQWLPGLEREVGNRALLLIDRSDMPHAKHIRHIEVVSNITDSVLEFSAELDAKADRGAVKHTARVAISAMAELGVDPWALTLEGGNVVSAATLAADSLKYQAKSRDETYELVNHHYRAFDVARGDQIIERAQTLPLIAA